MKTGKLPLDMLSRLLGEIEITDPRVALGPRPGEDAALIDFGDRYLVANTDPITFATDRIGWYLVQINANDLAVMGATPRWLMATLLLPEATSAEQVGDLFKQLRDACAAMEITLVGGHTEITHDLNRPIAVGALLGEVDKERVVRSGGAQPGDRIVLAGAIAVEGTAILAREAEKPLRRAGVDQAVIDQANRLLFAPGISIVPAARIACNSVRVNAMHDPTEGGLATGLLEIAKAAGVGLTVYADRIPVIDECQAICVALGLDPLGLIASGSLLAVVPPADAPTLIAALRAQDIAAYDIGAVTAPTDGLHLADGEEVRNLPVFERDELARFLDQPR